MPKHFYNNFNWNRFSCEFHITQDDGDSDDEYSDDEYNDEDANEEASTLMSVHLDTFLEKRYKTVLVVKINLFLNFLKFFKTDKN